MIKTLLRNRRLFLDRWLENYTDDGSNFGDIEKMRVFSLRQQHNGKSAVGKQLMKFYFCIIEFYL